MARTKLSCSGLMPDNRAAQAGPMAGFKGPCRRAVGLVPGSHRARRPCREKRSADWGFCSGLSAGASARTRVRASCGGSGRAGTGGTMGLRVSPVLALPV